MDKPILNIIINEQHNLLEEQVSLIKDTYIPEVYRHIVVRVPAKGWTLSEQMKVMENLKGVVLFISPIPFMIKALSQAALINVGNHFGEKGTVTTNSKVFQVNILANDTREKVELPGGKIIFKLAQTGWYIC